MPTPSDSGPGPRPTRHPAPARRSGADPTIATLARVLDPLAYDERAEVRTLGQLWDQISRRMTAELHASRAIAAGWQAPHQNRDK